MTSQKTGDDLPARQVNHILQNLRGEHFRHARNAQGMPASSSSLLFHAHNQPTLPIDLIYPSSAPAASSSRAPGPRPPRSWRLPATSTHSPSHSSIETKQIPDVLPNTPAWRARALSLLFSTDLTPPLSRHAPANTRSIYPDPSPVPRLTLFCLQLIREACPGADLGHVASYIPPHLRRALMRYAAVHAPLSRMELDALRQDATHVDTELLVVGPGINMNTLRARVFRGRGPAPAAGARDGTIGDGLDVDSGHTDGQEASDAWDADADAVQMQDSELLALRFLAVVSSPLSAGVLLGFPPTITHLALIHIPQRIPLQRLPMICPLIVFLDLSYNTWLGSFDVVESGASMLEEVEWGKLRRLEVVGLRECVVTPKLLLELNRKRWEGVKVIQ